MKLTASTENGNELFSGKPMKLRTNDTTQSVQERSRLGTGANVENGKTKYGNGKIGSLKITTRLKTNEIGEYQFQSFRKSPYRNAKILERIIKRLDTGEWVKCPVCTVEWNRLTPNGICYNCDPVEQELRKKPWELIPKNKQ